MAAATDEEYMQAAAQALRHAKWGMFFIPGIGREEDIRLAARYGMSFLRIGTNVTEAAQAEPYIALAKELGLIVSYNAMKSYAVSPDEFGAVVAQVHQWGSDIACLVDSAGSMDPDSVAAFLQAAKQQSPSPLGYHGHDNLSLAMANTLRAIEEGAVLVDSSLQGMGRSAGNTVTEVLVAILQRRDFLPHIDLKAAMDVGQGLIQPLLGKRGVDPMAITGGLAKFHSSFTGKVQRYARNHGVDARDLIVRLCQEDQVSAPDELLERLSHELATLKMPACSVDSRVPDRIGQRENCCGIFGYIAEGTSRPRSQGGEIFGTQCRYRREAAARVLGLGKHPLDAVARGWVGDADR